MDAAGDASEGFIDIISVTVQQLDQCMLEFTMELAAPIPDSFDSYLYYGWSVDADRNVATGEQHGGIGADYVVRVCFDPDSSHQDSYGWHGWGDGGQVL